MKYPISKFLLLNLTKRLSLLGADLKVGPNLNFVK